MSITQIKQASLITAIKTPYQKTGEIDFAAFDKLVVRQIKAGTDGLVICGTTGEGHLMSWKENISLIRYAVEFFGKDLLIIGNTGSNSTKEAKQATQEATDNGCHACLQINPYYGKTNEAGILLHLETSLNIAPCFIYNVPSRTAQDITPTIIEKLQKHPNFIGVKECAGCDRIDYYEKKSIACWSGNDDQAFESRHAPIVKAKKSKDSKSKASRSHGVISVTANVIPALFRILMDENNEELQKKILPFTVSLFIEPNPIVLNTVLAMMGLCKPVSRLPYLPLEIEKQEKIITALETLKESCPELSDLEQIKVIPPENFTLL